MRAATDETPARAPVRRTARRIGSRIGRTTEEATGRVANTTVGEHAARAGLATRGVVYLVLGYLVARVASGVLGAGRAGEDEASSKGVVQVLIDEPGGRVALVLLAIGLTLYALFSFVDAVRHHDDENPAVRRWAGRLLSGWGVLAYGFFAAYCLRAAITGPAAQGSSQQTRQQDREWSARVLNWPGGWFWLGSFGAVLLVVSAFMLSRAIRRNFRERLQREDMGRVAWSVALITGTLGNVGRSGLFAVVGWFVLTAAVEDEPSRSSGVDGSIRQLAGSPAGPALLWLLAVALAAYGAYVIVEARYRRV